MFYLKTLLGQGSTNILTEFSMPISPCLFGHNTGFSINTYPSKMFCESNYVENSAKILICYPTHDITYPEYNNPTSKSAIFQAISQGHWDINMAGIMIVFWTPNECPVFVGIFFTDNVGAQLPRVFFFISSYSGIIRQSSQTLTGMSHPLVGTGRRVALQSLHTPCPHCLQWWTRMHSWKTFFSSDFLNKLHLLKICPLCLTFESSLSD